MSETINVIWGDDSFIPFAVLDNEECYILIPSNSTNSEIVEVEEILVVETEDLNVEGKNGFLKIVSEF